MQKEIWKTWIENFLSVSEYSGKNKKKKISDRNKL